MSFAAPDVAPKKGRRLGGGKPADEPQADAGGTGDTGWNSAGTGGGGMNDGGWNDGGGWNAGGWGNKADNGDNWNSGGDRWSAAPAEPWQTQQHAQPTSAAVVPPREEPRQPNRPFLGQPAAPADNNVQGVNEATAAAIVAYFTAAKASAFAREDFDEAERLKEELSEVQQLAKDLVSLESKKRESASKEDGAAAGDHKRAVEEILQQLTAKAAEQWSVAEGGEHSTIKSIGGGSMGSPPKAAPKKAPKVAKPPDPPLQVTIVSGRLAKSSKDAISCTCEIEGRGHKNFKTESAMTKLNWSHDGQLAGFKAGDALVFKLHSMGFMGESMLGTGRLPQDEFPAEGEEKEVTICNSGGKTSGYVTVKITQPKAPEPEPVEAHVPEAAGMNDHVFPTSGSMDATANMTYAQRSLHSPSHQTLPPGSSAAVNEALAVIEKLKVAKAEAVAREDFETAKHLKDELARLETLPDELARLHAEKMDAVAREDYAIALDRKTRIDDWMQALSSGNLSSVAAGNTVIAVPPSPQSQHASVGQRLRAPPRSPNNPSSPSGSNRGAPVGDAAQHRLEAELKAAQWELRCWQLAADGETTGSHGSPGDAMVRRSQNTSAGASVDRSTGRLPRVPGRRPSWEGESQEATQHLGEGDAVLVKEDFGEVTSDYGLRVWLRKGQKGTVLFLCDDGSANIKFGGHCRLVPRKHFAKLAVRRRTASSGGGGRSLVDSAINDLKGQRDSGRGGRPQSAGMMQGSASRGLRNRSPGPASQRGPPEDAPDVFFA